ncbi:hypothetical protein BFL36_10550 [Clavibacter michiganensis]|uniref:Uncharacterized protein n=1 Tax=Clavibacter michiganensis TaxID=28447 RepID=A0A251YCN4_9MICO|nr:hypothetical protein [Clavibacter michiganensis]OUE22004.1 hypothetical protein BFL36_10550 [Clavibacter michiganensis]
MTRPTSDGPPTPDGLPDSDALPGRSGDFAYVGGAPAPRPSEQPETSLDVLAEAVGILVDQPRRPSYRCRVVSQMGTTVQQHELVVRPLVGSYVCTDLATGLVDSSDGVSRVRIVGGEPQEMLAHGFPSVPLPARLAFPLQLPIWGRSNQYRMTGATRHAQEIIVELTHVRDPHLRGTLTVDTGRLLVTRLDAMGDLLHRMEVEPERWLVD